jgi:hypothetical protein
VLPGTREGCEVPRISSFYGIVIAMYYKEHGVPHFHARYAEHAASMAIDSLEILGGSLPARARWLVREWAMRHREELHANWDRARAESQLAWIEPLP